MTPQQQRWVTAVAAQVKEQFSGEGTGHDWWHILRVWNNAKHIARSEQCEQHIVELAALLHDIADWKFSEDEHAGGREAAKLLASVGADETTVAAVAFIVDNVSYKGAGHTEVAMSLEGQIVQDADRLDAIGALGIARAFAYGGHKGRELYNPDQPAEQHVDFAAYRASTGSTVNHFHEKLLLLKDRMHTQTAKHIAKQRHIFMEQYLAEFLAEWDGKR